MIESVIFTKAIPVGYKHPLALEQRFTSTDWVIEEPCPGTIVLTSKLDSLGGSPRSFTHRGTAYSFVVAPEPPKDPREPLPSKVQQIGKKR